MPEIPKPSISRPIVSSRASKLWCVFAISFVPNVLANTVHTITVPANNTQALIAVVDEANNAAHDDVTMILVSGEYVFTSKDILPPIRRTMTIEGYSNDSALFVGKLEFPQDEPDQLFKIEEEGELTLRHLDISDMSLSGHYSLEKLPLIENLGVFALEFVQFERVNGIIFSTAITGLAAHELIVNNGTIVMHGVSMVDVGMANVGVPPQGSILNNKATARLTKVQVLFEDENYHGDIENSGDLRVLNSTFVGTYPYTPWTLAIHRLETQCFTDILVAGVLMRKALVTIWFKHLNVILLLKAMLPEHRLL